MSDDWASVDWPGYVRTDRMRQQRWLLDNIIRQVGVDWDQGRTRYTAYAAGIDAEADFARIREQVRSFADIHHAFAAAATRREALATDTQAQGRTIEAREHYFTASILWGNAEWPLFGDSPLVHEYGQRKTDCFDGYIRHAPHPVRRVEIPMGSASLPGYLHLPRSGPAPYPCVVNIGGMDAFKEHRVAMYGDKLLERGFASLAVDLPGQGECLSRGLHVTADSTVEAGIAIIGWIGDQDDIDASRVALTGNSFGSFWATQIAAAAEDDALAGCAVTGVIHEPGMHTIFEEASPTFKARFMYMAGMHDEAVFDKLASSMDLTPVAGSVRCPYMVVAGENDELSPLPHTFRLVERILAPVTLVVYQGERHSIGGGAASRFGPNRHHLVADWIADRFGRIAASDEYCWVDATGKVQRRDPFWRGQR
jgi:dipeptidyl aminopeptidase/acylaminoacyl peptidase